MPSTSTTLGSSEPVAGGELPGLWSGTFTVTDISIPEDMVSTVEEEGCSVAALEAMKGQALPTTMEITVDSGGQSGTAVMNIDASSLAVEGAEGGSEPMVFTFTIQGNTVTFQASDDASTTMTGTVGKQGQTLVMTGTMFIGESGMGMSAEWQVTKQIIM